MSTFTIENKQLIQVFIDEVINKKNLLALRDFIDPSIEGKLEASEAGLTFSRDKTIVGRVPLPIKQLEEKIISQRFTQLTTSESARYESLQKGMKNVTGVTVEGDKLNLTLSPAQQSRK